MWLNENGIANLISIPKLEADGYVVRTDTKGEWQVVTPKGETIPFNHDKGMCVGVLYIDLQEFKQGLVLIETVRKTWEDLLMKKLRELNFPGRRTYALEIRPTRYSSNS